MDGDESIIMKWCTLKWCLVNKITPQWCTSTALLRCHVRVVIKLFQNDRWCAVKSRPTVFKQQAAPMFSKQGGERFPAPKEITPGPGAYDPKLLAHDVGFKEFAKQAGDRFSSDEMEGRYLFRPPFPWPMLNKLGGSTWTKCYAFLFEV